MRYKYAYEHLREYLGKDFRITLKLCPEGHRLWHEFLEAKGMNAWRASNAYFYHRKKCKNCYRDVRQ